MLTTPRQLPQPAGLVDLSLHVSYPAEADVAAARAAGVDPDGHRMMHGQPNGRGWLAFWRQRREHSPGCAHA